MIWLLRDLDFVAVLLRAATLSFEALVIGGTAYLFLIAMPLGLASASVFRGRYWLGNAAIALVVSQAISTAVTSAMLASNGPVILSQLLTADYFIAGSIVVGCSVGVWIISRLRKPYASLLLIVFCSLILSASVSMSHATTRLDHRVLLVVLTVLHHLGTAMWIGAMPFLLVSMRHAKGVILPIEMVKHYSWMAVAGAATIVGSGIGMALFYVASWSGMYATPYGMMLGAKIYLLLLVLMIGAINFLLARQAKLQPSALLARVRSLSEVEVGLAFTILLATASLTSQAPAVDITVDRLSTHEIAQRMHWKSPRLQSPPVADLAVPSSMATAVRDSQFTGGGVSDASDKAWSEYNHHWAGLVVIMAGLLAFASRSGKAPWARHWPLAFLGLAVFILLRADPENWPLGPRGFWESFATPDVLQHRLYALLILSFAAFEWGVQTGRFRARWPTLIFPATCAMGGALLLAHSHAIGNAKEELLAGMNHTAIALMGTTAGWSRWGELRSSSSRASRFFGNLWPLCITAVGLLLVNYRET